MKPTDRNRPYFRQKVQQLEQEFEKHKSDPSIVRALRAELDHRTRQRALRLRRRIDAYLKGSAGTDSSPDATPPARASVQPTDPFSSPKPAAVPSHPPIAKVSPPRTPEASPPVTNRPEQLLEAWTALEVLSPATYIRPEDLAGGERSRIVPLSEECLPWLLGRRSRPERRMYYQVVLGSIRMEPAVARLLERYGDSRPERPSSRGRAALAIVILDSRGGSR
jgi:hypothetical protein